MGALTFVEKFFWGMVSIIVLLIVAFAILRWAENAGGGNIFGTAAAKISGWLTPPAS